MSNGLSRAANGGNATRGGRLPSGALSTLGALGVVVLDGAALGALGARLARAGAALGALGAVVLDGAALGALGELSPSV